MKKIYLDTDFLICLLISNDLMRVFKMLYSNYEILVPHEVRNEIFCQHKKSANYKLAYMNSLANEDFFEAPMYDLNSIEYSNYININLYGMFGLRAIDSGESSCISLCLKNSGELASNNLSDVKMYCTKNNIKCITTSLLILNAYRYNLLIDSEAENIWRLMNKNNRMMPELSFKKYKEKYYAKFGNGK